MGPCRAAGGPGAACGERDGALVRGPPAEVAASGAWARCVRTKLIETRLRTEYFK